MLDSVKHYNPQDPVLRLDRRAANALLKAQKMLPPNHKFVISEAWRSYQHQYNINEEMKEQIKKSHPNNWEELLNIYTGGEEYLEWLRNNPRSRYPCQSHASGLCLDIVAILKPDGRNTLNLGGEPTFDDRDRLDYYERRRPRNKKEEELKANRLLFKNVMTTNGFANFEKEWWHWGYCR